MYRHILFTGRCGYPLHPDVVGEVSLSSVLAPGVDQRITEHAWDPGVYLLASLRIENHIILDKRHVSLRYEPCISYRLPSCSITVSSTQPHLSSTEALHFPLAPPRRRIKNIYDKRHIYFRHEHCISYKLPSCCNITLSSTQLRLSRTRALNSLLAFLGWRISVPSTRALLSPGFQTVEHHSISDKRQVPHRQESCIY